MHAGRGFLGDAPDRGGVAAIPAGLATQTALDRGVEDFLFLVRGRLEESGIALLGAKTQMNERRRVAAVVEDHVRAPAVAPFENAMRVIPIVLQALALDGEDRRAGRRDRRGGVILRRIDVARSPADFGAERLQRFDQHRRLDRHVKRTGDASALQRLGRGKFGARRHQTRHFGLGDRYLLAPIVGEAEIRYSVILRFDGHATGLGVGSRPSSKSADMAQ